jgi:hypothetical protein
MKLEKRWRLLEGAPQRIIERGRGPFFLVELQTIAGQLSPMIRDQYPRLQLRFTDRNSK